MRFYRALLHLYPSSFRAEYGDELCDAFRRRAGAPRAARSAGSRCGSAPSPTSSSTPRACTADILAQDLRLHASARCGARPASRSPRSSSPPSASAPRPRRSRLRTTCWCARCRSPSRTGWSRSGRTSRSRGYRAWSCSPANYRDWRAASTGVRVDGGVHGGIGESGRPGEPERLDGVRATGSSSRCSGAGRARPGLRRADGRRGAAPAVVLSDAPVAVAVRRRPAVLGRTVVLNGDAARRHRRHAARLHVPDARDGFWVPPASTAQSFEDRTNVYLDVVARLGPGVSIEAAGAELRVIAAQPGARHSRRRTRRTSADVVAAARRDRRGSRGCC